MHFEDVHSSLTSWNDREFQVTASLKFLQSYLNRQTDETSTIPHVLLLNVTNFSIQSHGHSNFLDKTVKWRRLPCVSCGIFRFLFSFYFTSPLSLFDFSFFFQSSPFYSSSFLQIPAFFHIFRPSLLSFFFFLSFSSPFPSPSVICIDLSVSLTRVKSFLPTYS